ncbi:ABC transporter permease subunit [Phytomonospora sp. NPDC050363]|uniref:ABC transporter permease n=1 Tax=Phytomonospora sp. NPDC050363 TaxID=3155642 RepID=UPI0033EEA163
MNRTIARLTMRGLLSPRRLMLLSLIPLVLLAVAGLLRGLAEGLEIDTATTILSSLAIGTVLPLIALICGTGAIATEIDDGSVVYLLAKPIGRPTIVLTKYLVALFGTILLAVVPTAIAAFILAGADKGIVLGFTASALVGALGYSALFLLLGVVTRHAVVVGLLYVLIWESLVGGAVPGAQALSIQQWSLSIGEKIAADGLIASAVSLPVGASLLTAVALFGLYFAVQRLRSLTLAGEQ